MKTKQITTESGIVLLLVEVPHGADEISIVKEPYLKPCLDWWMPDSNGVVKEVGSFELPEGNWQGKHFNEMSENESDGLAQYDDDRCCESPKEALYQEITSNGFNPETTVVLTLKK